MRLKSSSQFQREKQNIALPQQNLMGFFLSETTGACLLSFISHIRYSNLMKAVDIRFVEKQYKSRRKLLSTYIQSKNQDHIWHKMLNWFCHFAELSVKQVLYQVPVLTQHICLSVCVVTSCLSAARQCLQNQSSDIRLVSERVLWWVFRDPATPSMEAGLIKPLLKSLLDNTKDKNTSVRAQSEHTIVSLLRLRQGEETMQVRL